jgi:FkbM family methyltransferase
MRPKVLLDSILKPLKVQILSDWELRLNGTILYSRRRDQALNRLKVSKVLDVGANRGQYAHEFRNSGFTGDIVSFEPLKDAFAELASKANRDPKWQCHNVALGDFDGETLINKASFDQESSLLGFSREYCNPETQTVAREPVKVTKLSTVWSDLVFSQDIVFVKLDVQGFESQVLDGLGEIPKNVVGFELELSLSPVYEGQVLFPALVSRIYELGFQLYCLEEVLNTNIDDRVLLYNGLFCSRHN